MEYDSIKDLISRVNSTLSYYEKDFVSAQRTPDLDRERCSSFEEYLEIRFNHEAYRIPELKEAVEKTEGRLFSCIEIEEPDLAKRRFKTAKMKLLDPEMLLDEDQNLKDEIIKIQNLLGGNEISFNCLKKKIKFTIDNG